MRNALLIVGSRSEFDLTTDGTGGESDSVCVREEGRRVGLDLPNGEPLTRVGAVGDYTSREGALETSVAGPSTEFIDGRVGGRVRESDTRRTSSSEGSLVDVSGSDCGRLVVTGDLDSDGVADDLF